MASIYWKGSAPAVAGVKSWTFTTAATAGETITITIGSKSYVYTLTSGTIATFLPLLVTALNALDSAVYPEFAEITWSSTSPALIATDDTTGKPSIVTVSTNSATTTINSGSITGATNATPIVITSASHGLSTGSVVTVASVGGTTAANGTWIITRVSANTFSLDGSVGNGAYTAGGTWTAPTGNTTTLSSGPKSIRTPANYSGGAVPVTGDTLTIDLEGAELLYDLEFHSTSYGNAVVLAVRRIIAKDVTIGLPKTNEDGTAYTEYRQDFWQCTASSDYVATQSNRLKLDHLAGQTTYEQDASGTGLEENIPAVLLRGSHASNVWNFFGGQAGLGLFAGDSFVAATLRIDPDAAVIAGFGCTLATVNNYGGNLLAYCAISTALNHPGAGGAKTTIEGSGAVAQITLEGGTCNYNTTGTLGGNTVLGGNAVLTLDEDARAKTITNAISLYTPSARFVDSYNRSAPYTLKYVHCVGPVKLAPNSQIVVSAL